MEHIKAFFLSKRTYGIWLLPALVLAWLFWTDPDQGDSTRDMLQNFVSVSLAFTASHFVRKYCLNYIKLEDHVEEAKKGNVGSGLVVLATIIFTCVAAFIFSGRAHAADVRTYVPVGAKQYCPMLMQEKDKYWPDHPDPAALCSLVEQESCISLTHTRCWNPKSRLKTNREEGAGFGQITRAYRADGTIRFDALQAAKQLDASLSEWSWSNVYDRPDLQLRATVVMNKDCARRLSRFVKDPAQVLRMCDSSYNGGYEGLQQERRACGQRARCDPQVWAGNVEKVCLKSKVKWKGYGASACDINRGHVDMVFNVRHDKYLPFVRPT